MTVHLPDHRLSYFSVPKCGCTSLKSFFFEFAHGLPFAEAQAQGHKAVGKKRFVHNVYPSRPFAETSAASGEGFARIAVVRDPVSRIVSCYANKIQQKKVLDVPALAEKAEADGLSTTPSFAEFVRDLDGYQKISDDIEHHSLPLSHFLGTDPSYFTRIFALSEMPLLIAFVAEHTGRDVPALPHVQRSKSARVMTDVSEADAARLRARFAEDTELFGAFFQTAKSA